MDADVFSQPIGFIPRFPVPPKYIKVRSHGKKEKEFDRLFLAQELRGKTGVEFAQSGGRLVKNGGFRSGDPRKDGNAIWAMEFSKDGRYLAVGGQDFSLRVWAVIATTEDRRTHEVRELGAFDPISGFCWGIVTCYKSWLSKHYFLKLNVYPTTEC